jgi:membrane fusion protein (multidrug efflux system)
MNKKHLHYSIIAAVVLLIALLVMLYLHHQKYYPNTDDAYVKAHIVQIAPQITGSVAEVKVHDLQQVKKDDVLFTLDRRPFQIAYDHAMADYVDTQKSSARTLTLVKQRLLSPADGDKAETNLKIAKSNLDKAQLDLEYSVIKAPEDGYIVKLDLRPGAAVTAYQALFSLIGTRQWWVEANFKETDLERIKQGQKATVVVDIYPKHPFHGVVDNVSRGSGASFSLLPAENATGNWVKVTARFPVRVNITDPDPNFPLRVGASAVVTIDTKSAA